MTFVLNTLESAGWAKANRQIGSKFPKLSMNTLQPTSQS